MRQFTKYPSSSVMASSFRRELAEQYPGIISNLRHDIREVARCENQAELEACKAYGNMGYHWELQAQRKGITDFDEKLDMIIDDIYSLLNMHKGFLTKKTEEIAREDQAVADIESYLTSSGISYDVQEDGIHVFPESATREDLIQFIDNLIAATGGTYHGTGRGSSWSAWHVLINGIDFEVGPRSVVNLGSRGDGQDDCWLIKP